MKNKNEQKIVDRIPYNIWINSQLSVARFYGGIKIDGKQYEFDPEEFKKFKDPNVQEIYPDLVLFA